MRSNLMMLHATSGMFLPAMSRNLVSTPVAFPTKTLLRRLSKNSPHRRVSVLKWDNSFCQSTLLLKTWWISSRAFSTLLSISWPFFMTTQLGGQLWGLFMILLPVTGFVATSFFLTSCHYSHHQWAFARLNSMTLNYVGRRSKIVSLRIRESMQQERT